MLNNGNGFFVQGVRATALFRIIAGENPANNVFVLKDERALVFMNLMNGVPVCQVARDFRKSEPDVMHIFRFILRKD
jgi:hypothetical protein